MLNLDKFNLSK